MKSQRKNRILVVDPDRNARQRLERVLHRAGYEHTLDADSVEAAREKLDKYEQVALLLLEMQMMGRSGLELLEDLAEAAPRTVVVVVTNAQGLMTAIEAMKKGAYDYVLKPIDAETVQLTVGLALKRRTRELDERDERRELRELVEKRVSVLEKTRSAFLRAMCRLAEFGSPHGPVHPVRVAHYSRLLAEQLARHSAYAPFIDDEFLLNTYEAAVLHDVGRTALPQDILTKPSGLTPEERELMESHTTVGREICRAVQAELDEGEDALIEMAVEVTGSHHERWDGDGYPDGLAATDIPLSARIVGLADYYDIWRTPMAYRPEVLSRAEIRERIVERSATKFDPIVVDAFKLRQRAFARIEEEWDR
ncbi:MAG: response regulator [Candidatus Brocadiia bacterium]